MDNTLAVVIIAITFLAALGFSSIESRVDDCKKLANGRAFDTVQTNEGTTCFIEGKLEFTH